VQEAELESLKSNFDVGDWGISDVFIRLCGNWGMEDNKIIVWSAKVSLSRQSCFIAVYYVGSSRSYKETPGNVKNRKGWAIAELWRVSLVGNNALQNSPYVHHRQTSGFQP
jgi:hypothetical protein